MKGAEEVFRRIIASNAKLDASTVIGTKRRRCVKSGADELLDQEAEEADEDEEEIRLRTHVLITRSRRLASSTSSRLPSADRGSRLTRH